MRIGIGSYKFYLLANIEEYWDRDDYPDFSWADSKNAEGNELEKTSKDSPFVQYIKASEENLKNIKLHFNGLIQNGHLPMICLAENVCKIIKVIRLNLRMEYLL